MKSCQTSRARNRSATSSTVSFDAGGRVSGPSDRREQGSASGCAPSSIERSSGNGRLRRPCRADGRFVDSGAVSRARWFIAVGLSVSCVPVDHLTIPDDVDWLAFVGVQVEGYEDGRLYPADDVDTIVTPDEGWLVGYRNEQLANEYFPPEQLRRVSVRFARPSEAWLPDPVWTRSFGGPRPLGGLTAARLGLKAPEVTLPAPLRVESSLEIIDRGGLEAVGQARNGAFLLVFADRTVHEVSTYRTRLLSEHNCSEDVRSVARYGPQYRITTAGLDVCEGVDLLQLEKKPLCREGAFHIDGFLQWLFVGTNGDVLQVEYNGSVPCTGRSADAWSGFQVSNDLSGYLIATGNTWNLHERLGFGSPRFADKFALCGHPGRDRISVGRQRTPNAAARSGTVVGVFCWPSRSGFRRYNKYRAS